MKRLVVSILALAVLSTAAVGVYAAPEAAATGKVGLYEGSFRGTAYGDEGSRAPVALELTHRDNKVAGTLSLDEGLYVNGGWCGAVSLPASTVDVEGQTTVRKPKRLEATPTLNAGGFNITVDFESNVSASGKVITAKAKVDLPWFCGRDPVLTATMLRD